MFQYVRVDDKGSAMISIKRGVPQESILSALKFLINFDNLGADAIWQSEIIKDADDTVLIEKPHHKSEDGILLECRMSKNGVDCNYMITKCTAFVKRSTKHSNIVIGDHESSSCGNEKIRGSTFRPKSVFL